VRDEEFKAARLDTGFIPRFNERRATAERADGLEQTGQDIVVIAAAVHYARLQREATFNNRPSESENRWKMSSRAALHEGRDAVNFRRGHRD
jgi:hypothetical protein